MAASFLRVYVHEKHLLSAVFLRAEGGGQHPSLVRSALPCREPTVDAFTSFIRGCTCAGRLRLMGLIPLEGNRFFSGCHSSADTS